MSTDYVRLREALDYALAIIESYEMDIRNSGLNLVGQGFCQGDIYRNARQDIRDIAGLGAAVVAGAREGQER